MEGRVVQSLMNAIATLFANLTCAITRRSFSGNNRTESRMGLFKICHEEVVQIPGQLVVATNGGMYQADRSPLGLHVENGRELIRANTAVGTGNFYIRPNGVFYVSGDS